MEKKWTIYCLENNIKFISISHKWWRYDNSFRKEKYTNESSDLRKGVSDFKKFKSKSTGGRNPEYDKLCPKLWQPHFIDRQHKTEVQTVRVVEPELAPLVRQTK